MIFKINLWILFLIFIFVQCTKSVQSSNRSNVFRNSIIAHSLLKRIEHENWSDDEACFEDMRRWLLGVEDKKLWAIWYMDSNQLPVASLYGSRYHFGSFDQCLNPPWLENGFQMQYCMVDVTSEEKRRFTNEISPLIDIEEFVGMKTIRNRRLYINSFGVCLPSSCKKHSVLRISEHWRDMSHLPFGNISIEDNSCQTINDNTDISFGFYAFWFILFIMTGTAITVHVIEDYITDTKLLKIIKWFSPRNNFKALLNENINEITTLNGIRAYSAGTTIVLHYLYYLHSLTIHNEMTVEKDLHKTGEYLLHLDLIVDTFFAMSGLLNMKKLYETKSSSVNILWTRYLRYLAPYMLVLLFMASVSPHAISGPLLPKFMREAQEQCNTDWWIGLLMMGNIIRTNKMCYVTSWYVSCDFQLTILGIILAYFWRKNRNTGRIIFWVTLFISIIIPGISIYQKNRTPLLIYDNDEALDVNNNVIFNIHYVQSYCRACSYLIGFAFGYILTVYKPNSYKNKISKNLSLLGFFSGMSLMIIAIKLCGSLLYQEYNAVKTSIFSSIERPIWAIGVCLVVAMCEYGDLPLIKKTLSNKSMMFFSKLSYGAYMYHLTIMYKVMYSVRAPVTYDRFGLVINGLGYVVISYFISFILWFIVEAPVNNMISDIWSKKRVIIHENGYSQKENGIKDIKNKVH